jgi:hypothetical protein
MNLLTIDEYITLNEHYTTFIGELRTKHPDATDNDLDYYIKAIFYSGHDNGVTESKEIQFFKEYINENIAIIALKAGKVKSSQKKANDIKIKKAGLENKSELQKDQIMKKFGNATDDKSKEAKSKAKESIDNKTKSQIEILNKKESELEARAEEKSTGSKFLDSYRKTIKHKGELAALEVSLKNASEKEAIEIKRTQKELSQKIREEKAKAKEESKAASEREEPKDNEDSKSDNK